MKTGVIYKITCINNGCFIFGQTVNFKNRCKSYKTVLKKGKGNRFLQNCYNKYGWESLKFELIQENIPIEIILFVEDIWIGANCSLITDNNKGMNVLTSTEIPKPNKELIKKHLKNSSTLKNKVGYLSLRGKEVHKYNLDGNYIESYGSCYSAAKQNNCLSVSISNCVKNLKNGKSSKASNFMWTYEKYDKIEKYISTKENSTCRKSINQYDSNKNFIKTYHSIAEACRETKSFDANIIKSIKSNFKYKSKGFYWNYN